MLAIDKLSYWEKVTYFQNIDHLIVGSGIVGLSTALALKMREPKSKVVILERGYLPTGASTKNAGFACFGSPSELLNDINSMGEEKTARLLKLRWEGLQLLLNTVGSTTLDYHNCGSYDLFLSTEKHQYEQIIDHLPFLNKFVLNHLNLSSCYQTSNIPQSQGMQNLCGSIFNQHEGSINTGQMMHRLIQLVYENGISILCNMQVENFIDKGENVAVNTQFGSIEANELYVCTNGLSQKLLPHLDLKPARAQVLVTSPIHNLKLDSTYHYDSGYYYFRTIENNRILIGGARNQDFEGETTEELSVTENIKSHIIQLLREVIIPNVDVEIDYAWAGIMGLGEEKIPIIESQTARIHYAVRMGGMGVAMGMKIGTDLSELSLKN
jgi:gamma-glutamylputrescine oxidase